MALAVTTLFSLLLPRVVATLPGTRKRCARPVRPSVVVQLLARNLG